jgi:hypothetical protein
MLICMQYNEFPFTKYKLVPKNSVDTEQIQTIKPDGAKGVRIHIHTYLEVARSIFQHLCRNDEVTIVDLLSGLENDFQDLSKGNGSFIYIALHVKLDLERRGYLKLVRSELNPRQVQKCIRITEKGWQYIKSII